MRANYAIVKQDDEMVLIQDLGPWNVHKTITNDAENVVAEMSEILRGRKLYYIDSEGETSQLVHHEGRFVSFAL